MSETIETPTEKKTKTPDNFKQFRVAASVHAEVMGLCDVLGIPSNIFFARLIEAVKGDMVEAGVIKETPLSRKLLGLPSK